MSVPLSIGFIMDGNRRWAKEQGQPSLAGHLEGYENFYRLAEAGIESGVKHLVFYALSTENWRRSEEEIAYLMTIIRTCLGEIETRLKKHQARIRFMGRREDFPADIAAGLSDVENRSAHYTRGTVWIALSYGGRAEITTAVNAAIEKGEPVTEESFKNLLWSSELPDPDLIIRTGGEQRLSNFLTWGGVYSELFFTKTLWPAFTPAEFLGIVEAYGQRTRRHGK